MAKDLSENQEKTHLHFTEENLTVDRAGELRKTLMDAIAHAQSTVICFRENQKTDISFLQLVHAAHLAALDNGKELCLDRRLPENFLHSVRIAGYTHHHFWAEQLERATTSQGGTDE